MKLFPQLNLMHFTNISNKYPRHLHKFIYRIVIIEHCKNNYKYDFNLEDPKQTTIDTAT